MAAYTRRATAAWSVFISFAKSLVSLRGFVRLFYHREKPSVKSLTKVFDRKMFRLFGIFRFWSGALSAGLSLPALHRPDGRLLARDVRLTVRAGEKLLLCGRNGAGKSTLLHPLTARRAGAMLSASINKR